MQSRPLPAERRLFQTNRSARLFLILAIAAGFTAAACIVAGAYALSEVVDGVFLKGQSLQDVSSWLAVLLGLAFARAALIWCGDVLAQRSASHLKGSLREGLSRRLLTLGPAYTQRERSGELVNTMVEGVEVLDEYITTYLPARALAGVVPLFVLIVTLFIDPPTTLILIFTGAIVALDLALIGGRTKDVTERRFVELSWMSAFFLDMLQGLATLKMFGRSREQVENIREISQRYGNTTMEVLRMAFQTGLVLEWGGTIATALVAVQVSLRLMSGLLPFDRALAVLIITPEFFLPLRQLAIRYHAGTAGKTAAARIFEILDTRQDQLPQPVPSAAEAPALPTISPETVPTTAAPARLDIRFERVAYAYEGGKRPALNDLSLTISHGERLALVGPTGAGKTTVASLLLRFIAPDQGRITVSGVSLSEIDPSEWRARVAWVPQIPHLFHGSLADNLRLARPEASDEALIAAARAAHAHEFIQQLPQGYDTPIGEEGARLSGGQRQRLAIARAFLKDAPFLILDEATSHLDSASEAAIREALQNLTRGRTVLIIAHRLALAYTADRIAVLDGGRVIESGDPRQLLGQQGPYQQLVAIYEGGEV
jgi:thiol reductant ABC exporter CydD subunit